MPSTTNTNKAIEFCMRLLTFNPNYDKQYIRIIRIIRSYISSMKSLPGMPFKGFVINAGFVDDILYIGLGVPEVGDSSLFLMNPMWMTPQHMILWKMC